MEIRLYHIDTLEYMGSIIPSGPAWEYRDVRDSRLLATTRGMPLKALLANLVAFDLVYDIIEDQAIPE
jgi:hypothetical protein